MCDGRGKLEWGQTAAVLSMIHNVNCTKDSDRQPPDHFNPYAGGEKKPKGSDVIMIPITALKAAFLKE